MIRLALSRRRQWRRKIRDTGLTFCSHWWNRRYWDESACYQFESAEIDQLKKAGQELQRLYTAATDAVIQQGWWSLVDIPDKAVATITESWRRQDPALCGRFDLAWAPGEAPKLLEYNADTPMTMLETGVTQQQWLAETGSASHHQFNHLHERLVAVWKQVAEDKVHLTGCLWCDEDSDQLNYLARTIREAGKTPCLIDITHIGWDKNQRAFVDLDRQPIQRLFKLYPWEWLWDEPFSRLLPLHRRMFIEPAWKMLWNSKGMLAVLWQLFPDHPNLLPAFRHTGTLLGSYVAKPMFSREGRNVVMVKNNKVAASTRGPYASSPRVYQAIANNAQFDGQHPTFGLWMVQDQPSALGIREDRRLITHKHSRFVPHRVTH